MAVLTGLPAGDAEQGETQRIATIDQDATIIESHKQAARAHYKDGRGYQPMVALWAELDLVVADECGVCFVPHARAAEVLEKAAKIAHLERQRLEKLAAGMPLAEWLKP